MTLGNTQEFASPEEALAHYGVKGMRWGVRKQEDTGDKSDGVRSSSSTQATAPHPEALTDKQRARAERFLKNAEVMGTSASELKQRNENIGATNNPVKLYEKYTNNQARTSLEKAQKTAVKDAEAVHKGKMTSKQKQVVIGALAVGGLLAAGAATTYIARGQQSGAFNSYRLLTSARLQGKKSPFNINKDLAAKMSAEDILKKVSGPVNPNFRSAGGQMNCRRSTYAHELRRRGYDVSATTSAVGWGQSQSGVINALTPGSKNFYDSMSMSKSVVDTGFDKVVLGDSRTSPVKKILLDKLINEKPSFQEQARAIRENGGRMPKNLEIAIANAGRSNSKKVLDELAKQPSGARGEVLFKFGGFGHSMAYEVINGVPHIFDSQKANHYHAAGKMVESKWDGFHSAEIMRLDNVDLDTSFLTRWATNVKR